MGTSNYNRVMAGRRSRAVGDYFEQTRTGSREMS